MVPRWDKSLTKALETGEDTDSVISPRNAGTKSNTFQMEVKHPGYLHELWRYAIRTKGSGATYRELAETMNEKSASPAEQRTELSMSGQQLSAWFKLNKGVERSSKEKPMLTHDEMKKLCLAWVQKYGHLLTNPHAEVAELDNKWFYKQIMEPSPKAKGLLAPGSYTRTNRCGQNISS
jgi:hypothetical protein